MVSSMAVAIRSVAASGSPPVFFRLSKVHSETTPASSAGSSSFQIPRRRHWATSRSDPMWIRDSSSPSGVSTGIRSGPVPSNST